MCVNEVVSSVQNTPGTGVRGEETGTSWLLQWKREGEKFKIVFQIAVCGPYFT